jgi:hypothetical protein
MPDWSLRHAKFDGVVLPNRSHVHRRIGCSPGCLETAADSHATGRLAALSSVGRLLPWSSVADMADRSGPCAVARLWEW